MFHGNSYALQEFQESSLIFQEFQGISGEFHERTKGFQIVSEAFLGFMAFYKYQGISESLKKEKIIPKGLKRFRKSFRGVPEVFQVQKRSRGYQGVLFIQRKSL